MSPSIEHRPLPPNPSARVVRLWGAARRSTLGAAAASSSTRLDSAPPSLRHAPDSAWQRFMFWLLAPAPHDAAPPLNRLPRVREDFLFALADIPGDVAHAMRRRIAHAHSLRDLWHLRADLFNLVSVEHSQAEAEERLLQLNRHFPMRAARSTPRSTRSQFGQLGGP